MTMKYMKYIVFLFLLFNKGIFPLVLLFQPLLSPMTKKIVFIFLH